MIQELRKQNIEENNEPNDDTAEQSNELLSSTDMEFDIQDDEVHDKNGSNDEIEVEFLVDKSKVELISDVGDMDMPVNGDEGEN